MKPLRFIHIHICPVCHVKRECSNRVPFLECAELDYCPDHTPEPGCGHRDCDEQVRIIRHECRLCEKPIAYEKYTKDEHGTIVHFWCLAEAAEKGRA